MHGLNCSGPLASHNVLGIDLGGTNIRVGQVTGRTLARVESASTPADGSVDDVLTRIQSLIERYDVDAIGGIGIGVPSVVDVATGVVYDVQNIPSWSEVPVKDILETRYDVPVFVNNDANCFALGEFYFGTGRGCSSMLGLIIGTGFAGGVILDGRLYTGPHCGAGEFGMMPYKDSIYENYCAGLFFERQGLDGEAVFQRAQAGDEDALALFRTLGHHLGTALKAVLYAYDVPFIVFGGSVRHAYPYFRETMWNAVNTFAYAPLLDRLTVRVSELDHVAILGAAALVYDASPSLRPHLSDST
jgi:glucokinase